MRTDGEDETLGERVSMKAKMTADPFTAVQLGRSDRSNLSSKVRLRCGAAEHLSSPGDSVMQTCAVASISLPTTWLRPVTARPHHVAPNPARMEPCAWSNPERGWPSAVPPTSSRAARSDV